MNEKVAALEPTTALEVSEPLGYGGGSPVTEPDDFKDEETKENMAGAPTAEGKEKVEVAAAGREGGTETGAAEDSGFCGPGEVGVVGVLPDDLGCRSPSNESRSGVLMRDLTPGF